MTNHGQDNYGRDVTSEVREDGKIRYSVTLDGVGILFVDAAPTTPMWRVWETINAHGIPSLPS